MRARCNYDFLRASCRQESSKIAPAIGTRAHPAFTSGTHGGGLHAEMLETDVEVCAKARTGRIKVAATIQILRIWFSFLRE
jgi:hypothetical protein